MPRAHTWHSGHSDPARHPSHSGQPPSRNSADNCTESRSLNSPDRLRESPTLRSHHCENLPTGGLSRHLCVHSLATNIPRWLIQRHPTAFQPTAFPVYRARQLTRTPLQLDSLTDTPTQDWKGNGRRRQPHAGCVIPWSSCGTAFRVLPLASQVPGQKRVRTLLRRGTARRWAVLLPNTEQ